MIQNLQKSNIYLKTKLKELEEDKGHFESYHSADENAKLSQGGVDYQLVSIGHVDRVTHHNDEMPNQPIYPSDLYFNQ